MVLDINVRKQPNEPEYVWLRTIEKTTYNCYFYPKVISAAHEYSQLFGKACYASEGFCPMHESIIVWDKEILHACPYERLMSPTLQVVDENMLVDQSKHLIFQVTGVESVSCIVNNIPTMFEMFTSAEGVYISDSPSWLSFPIKDNVELKSVHKLILADSDLSQSNILKLYRGLTQRFCTAFLANLRIFSKFTSSLQ